MDETLKKLKKMKKINTVFMYYFFYFAQSQLNFAQSHDSETETFRNLAV